MRGPSTLAVGMVIFLGSELMFFAALFAAYFTLRGQGARWPPAGFELDLAGPSISTAALVASSGTMQVAIGRIRRGDRSGLIRWVGLTLLLGALFLVGQGFDYVGRNFQISSQAYGSTFYTLTGFHALHVLAGLILLAVLMGRAGMGAYSADRHAGVEAVGYYWHFVDVVWLGLYGTIFLIR